MGEEHDIQLDDLSSLRSSVERFPITFRSVQPLPKFLYIPHDECFKMGIRLLLGQEDWPSIWINYGITRAHFYAFTGNLKEFKASADLNATDSRGRCALHYAAGSCLGEEVVKWLLKQGESKSPAHPQLSLLDSDGTTALHQAVAGKHVGIVQRLVDAGANVNACGVGNMPPIYLAHLYYDQTAAEELSCYEQIIDILVSAKATVNDPEPETGLGVLYRAVELGSSNATEKLIRGGADVLMKDDVKTAGKTVLHFAAEADLLRILWTILNDDSELLKENPSKCDVPDKLGRTPLHAAVYSGHMQCVRFLIGKGLCLFNKDGTNKTVVDAIFQNVPQPVAFLTEVLDKQVTCTKPGKVVTMEFRMLDALPNTLSSRTTAFDESSKIQMLPALIEPVPNEERTAIIHHPLVVYFLKEIRISALYLECFIHIVSILYYFLLNWFIISCKASIYKEYCYSPVMIPIIVFTSLVMIGLRIGTFFILRRTSENFRTIWDFRVPIYVVWAMATLANALGICISFTAHQRLWIWIEVILTMLLPIYIVQVLIDSWVLPGQYIFMFFTVLYTVLKVLGTFASVIFSFALSFAIVFSGFDQFSNPWKSSVKTLVMMTGEYEYGSLFCNTTTSTNCTSVKNDDSGLVLSSIILLIFVIVINTVLMNLMVGLAVSDINRLLNESRSSWLKHRVGTVLRRSSRRYLIYWIYAKLGCRINEPTSTRELGSGSKLRVPWNEIAEDIKEALNELTLRKSSYQYEESPTESPPDNTAQGISTAS